MSFASRLRQAREQAGLTQQELAQQLSVTKSAVGNYENGVSSPKWDVLLKIFNVLQVEPNYLYQDSFSIPSSSLASLQTTLLDAFDQLNEEGQEKVISYAEDLVLTERYKKDAAARVAQEA